MYLIESGNLVNEMPQQPSQAVLKHIRQQQIMVCS